MVVNSQSKQVLGTQIGYELDGVYSGKSVFLSSGEELGVLEIIARTHLLENGADSVRVDFSVPLCELSVGDTISVKAPSYGVPLPDSKEFFVVSAVTHEFSELNAVTKVSAVRYDF